MPDLTPEQKKIIRLIEKESNLVGLDPDYAVALANLESGFKHIPAQVKEGEPPSTAFGPFQVNKATAKANGVDYDEMVKSPELAVRAGIQNILRHAKNPNLMTENPETGIKEIDPMRIAAAHRYGEGSDYAKTGNRKLIDPVLNEYLARAMEHFQDESFPNTIITKNDTNVDGTQKQVASDIDMGSVPLAVYDPAKAEQADREMSAEHGLEAGAILGAVKAPLFTGAQKLYEIAKSFKQGNLSPQDLNAVAQAVEKVKLQNANIPEIEVEKPLTSGEKYAAKTGYGEGTGTVKNVIDRQKLATPKGEISKRMYERRKAAESLSNVEQTALKEAQNLQTLENANNWANKVNNPPPKNPSPSLYQRTLGALPEAGQAIANAGRSILQSTPARWGLGGAGALFNLENASQQFGHDTNLGNVGGVASSGGALASLLSAVPKYAPYAGPAAIGLTTAGNVVGDIDRGDYDSAKANAYLGGLGLAGLPYAVGALLPTTLNRNEEEELARRRKMAPTITAP